MRTEDLRALSEVSHSLWLDSKVAQRNTVETLSAASLLDLTPENVIERAASALFERALREGSGNAYRNLAALNEPFFRLQPIERWILAALHRGSWSYPRLARVLQLNEDQVQELAWKARLTLAEGVRYPVPQAARGLSCPEFDPRKPWAQKLLDDEIISGQQRLFLQNHLIGCQNCQNLFTGSKAVFYAAEKKIPRLTVGDSERFVSQLQRIYYQARPLKLPKGADFWRSVRVLLKQWDIQVMLAIVAIIAISRWMR